jgi:hypothetical protein
MLINEHNPFKGAKRFRPEGADMADLPGGSGEIVYREESMLAPV